MRNYRKTSIVRREGKWAQFRKCSYMRENFIKMNLMEIRFEEVVWTQVHQSGVLWRDLMNFLTAENAVHFFIS
jgi:hypothetical protein